MPPSEQTDSTSGSVLPKLEPADAYTSTPESSPEAEAEIPIQQSDAPPVVKRKGGRKPIYATSEERKQRNRQAQAAFRERRTEYIKQLEETIKQQEATLQNLQQSHRSAADECLMLRYKNSLLERLLLEKGIDVQAELRMKGAPLPGANSSSQRPRARDGSPNATKPISFHARKPIFSTLIDIYWEIFWVWDSRWDLSANVRHSSSATDAATTATTIWTSSKHAASRPFFTVLSAKLVLHADRILSIFIPETL
ncbi:putative bzip transcription factor [Phaeomoniella chlamydospora]|uniref:Putative bzip transcription factor n=1 Tax=Phaeomoniella chlamydospora TaxID=158046 RepID=A0A0G2H807_PHACM|nr:putative bzip transcription factor [Phaeomoniella chlamydospora]